LRVKVWGKSWRGGVSRGDAVPGHDWEDRHLAQRSPPGVRAGTRAAARRGSSYRCPPVPRWAGRPGCSGVDFRAAPRTA